MGLAMKLRRLEHAHAHGLRVHVWTIDEVDEMNALLDGQPWLAGDNYSLADTVWTVGVARFMMLKIEPLEGRPALGDWYERVKARPSFEAANVWEYFDATAMLLMLGRKFLPQLLLIASGIALLVWWLVR